MMTAIELPAEARLKLGMGVLLCVLALVSMHRPDLDTSRAVAAFVVAWGYTAGVLAAAVRTELPRRR
jgi:hypothetical protein